MAEIVVMQADCFVNGGGIMNGKNRKCNDNQYVHGVQW